jgi:predicted amino acid dehydrogenase
MKLIMISVLLTVMPAYAQNIEYPQIDHLTNNSSSANIIVSYADVVWAKTGIDALDKALAICTDHGNVSTTGTGAKTVYSFEPAFDAMCQKVMADYDKEIKKKREDEARKAEIERQQQSVKDLAELQSLKW